MAYEAKRRRGPNKPKPQAGPDGETLPPVVQATPPEVTAEPAAQPARRRKRADIGGQHLKLATPQREGYHRHWFIDKPGRLAMAQDLAYDFVTEPGIKSDSPDSRVRRLVGTQEGGQPQNAYLMETPLEEYAAGQTEKEEARRPFEEAIRRGEDTLGSPLTGKTQSHESYLR